MGIQHALYHLFLYFLVSISSFLSISISSKNPFGSNTIPFPITFIVFGFNTPDGINRNANFFPSTTNVCPALFPPCPLTTTSACVAKVIYNFTFSFISPLRSYYSNCLHIIHLYFILFEHFTLLFYQTFVLFSNFFIYLYLF